MALTTMWGERNDMANDATQAKDVAKRNLIRTIVAAVFHQDDVGAVNAKLGDGDWCNVTVCNTRFDRRLHDRIFNVRGDDNDGATKLSLSHPISAMDVEPLGEGSFKLTLKSPHKLLYINVEGLAQ